ncbi:hypothetical protein WJX82_007282 [Trebouxia sp. C0006]
MRASQPTGFYLLVQADMKIYEAGYNLKMSVPTEVYNDLFAISARCSHNLVSRAHDALFARSAQPNRPLRAYKHAEAHIKVFLIKGCCESVTQCSWTMILHLEHTVSGWESKWYHLHDEGSPSILYSLAAQSASVVYRGDPPCVCNKLRIL